MIYITYLTINNIIIILYYVFKVAFCGNLSTHFRLKKENA